MTLGWLLWVAALALAIALTASAALVKRRAILRDDVGAFPGVMPRNRLHAGRA
jgi:hypothetical protein